MNPPFTPKIAIGGATYISDKAINGATSISEKDFDGATFISEKAISDDFIVNSSSSPQGQRDGLVNDGRIKAFITSPHHHNALLHKVACGRTTFT